MGKGSARRPCDENKVRKNWDNIFSPKNTDKDSVKTDDKKGKEKSTK